MIDILSKYFATEGCYTEKALDGKLALEKMNNNHLTSSLCPMSNMPGMDGVTFYPTIEGDRLSLLR